MEKRVRRCPILKKLTHLKRFRFLCHHGGQVVSMITFYSDNPTKFESHLSLQFLCKTVVEKNENKQSEAVVGHFKKGFILQL